MFRRILVPVLNVNLLVIHSRGQWNSELNLDGRNFHVREEGGGLLSKVLKALTILRSQQVEERMRVLVLLNSISFGLVHGLAERSHLNRQDGISLHQLLSPTGSTIELLYLHH